MVSVPPELLRQKLLGKVERKLDKQLEKAAVQLLVDPVLNQVCPAITGAKQYPCIDDILMAPISHDIFNWFP